MNLDSLWSTNQQWWEGICSQNTPWTEIWKPIPNEILESSWLFNYFIPCIRATNASMRKAVFLQCLACISWSSSLVHGSSWAFIHNILSKNFFTVTPKKMAKKKQQQETKRDELWDLPKCSKFMSCNLVKDMLSNLCLYNYPLPNYCNHSWAIHPLIASFNDHMESCFEPSWLTCLDKIMVTFTDEYAPNWVVVKCKPHPFGNEYHAIACCKSKIIFKMEVVETEKNGLKEGPYSKPLFEDTMTKTAALCVCMT